MPLACSLASPYCHGLQKLQVRDLEPCRGSASITKVFEAGETLKDPRANPDSFQNVQDAVYDDIAAVKEGLKLYLSCKILIFLYANLM